jgi:renal tumor antigen
MTDYRQASHMEFNFPRKEGTGIAKLAVNVSADAQEIIVKLLAYNQENRMSAGQALRHNYFKELREQDKSFTDTMGQPIAGPHNVTQISAAMRNTQRGGIIETSSHGSKSMTKIPDNISEGNYPGAGPKNGGGQMDKYKTKQPGTMVGSSNAGLEKVELKIENVKN